MDEMDDHQENDKTDKTCFLLFRLSGLHGMSIGLCANMPLLMAQGGMMPGLFWSGFAYPAVLWHLSPQTLTMSSWDDGGIVLATLQHGSRPRIMVGLCRINGDWGLGYWWDCVKT